MRLRPLALAIHYLLVAALFSKIADLQQYPALSCIMMVHQRTSKHWKIFACHPQSQHWLAGTHCFSSVTDQG